MTSWIGQEYVLVADEVAGYWALGPGRLTRLDASGLPIGSWTDSDDALIGGATTVEPARGGGVWLVAGTALAWFDGRSLRDVVAAPADVIDVAEAADGTLWVTLPDRVSHWDGRAWMDVCGEPGFQARSAILVDSLGSVWVVQPNPPISIARFDGSGWTSYSDEAIWMRPSNGDPAYIASLVPAADGSLWAFGAGIGRFVGGSWTTFAPLGVDLSGTVSMAVGPDGKVWAATGTVDRPGEPEDQHSGIAIVRYDGSDWRVYGAADGLPGPVGSSWSTITAVAASADGVVAATRDGFYRLEGDRWARRGPAPSASAQPGGPSAVVAISADEAWAGGNGLWHYLDGVWSSVQIADWDPAPWVASLSRGKDGTIAVAGGAGLAVLRHGRWTVLGSEEARTATVARDGAVWVLWGASPAVPAGYISSFDFDGQKWSRKDLPEDLPGGIEGVESLVAGDDGELWLGVSGWGQGSLNHFDGAEWTRVSLYGTKDISVLDLSTAPDGDQWAALRIGDLPALARHDDAGWTVFPTPDQTALGPFMGWIRGGTISFASDGTVWVSTVQGIARFVEGRWTFMPFLLGTLSAAPDGTLWGSGSSGIERVPAPATGPAG